MWSIYKITNNINGKSYIGQTSQKVENRWSEHKRGKTSKNSPLKRAIKKYGWENFTTEVIDTAETLEEALKKEIYWIDYYKTCILVHGRDCGYNLSRGGEGVFKITPEQEKIVVDLWNKNYNLTKIGNIMKIDRHTIRRILIRNGFSSEKLCKFKNYHYHPIYIYNLSGELIDTLDSLAETSEEYSYISKNQIGKVLNHKLSSTHELIFLYEEDRDKIDEHLLRSNKFHRGGVKSINVKTGQEQKYDTITEAEKRTGICRQTIRNRIRKNIIKDDIKWEDIN